MNTQPTPMLNSPEIRTSGQSLLTSDELLMLTDFKESSPLLPTKAFGLKRIAECRWPFAVLGLALVFVSIFSKPLDEREGLWKQPVTEVQTAPPMMSANASVSGWQAFQTWQGVLLDNPTPPLDPSILLPQPIPAVAQLNQPISNPTNATPLRGETSMPELSKSSSATVAIQSPAPTPTSSGSKGQTIPASGSTNILATILSGLSNGNVTTSPVSNRLAAKLSSSSSVAKSLSNLGTAMGSRANASSSSNAGTRENSNGGGFGFGGSRRG